MSWRHLTASMSHSFRPRGTDSPYAINRRCFIRKEHACGKVYGASKSCFIACPTDVTLEPTLALMSEKLTKHGVEPVVAVKERAYGQDIFCTKICGKIIEARFCAVILDDDMSTGKNIPNPNVYYEYGLMTALGKHIIPLQKAQHALAFNIQSYDTIKYAPESIATELERAIRDAIRLTDTEAESKETPLMREKPILRSLELAGFVAKDHTWYLASVIEDTLFRGFGSEGMQAYLYLGKVDSEEDARTYLEDLGVVLLRTERKAAELHEEKAVSQRTIEEVEAAAAGRPHMLDYRASAARDKLANVEPKLRMMETFYIGFILNTSVHAVEFRAKIEEAVAHYQRYRVVFSSGQALQIGEVVVDLGTFGR